MQCQFVEQPFDELEVGAGQRRNAHDIGAMRLHGCRHGRRLLKQRQAQDVESGVLERGCDDGRTAVVSVLAELGDRDARPASRAFCQAVDAEPVMPASELTDTAACTGGFGMRFSASLTTLGSPH